MKKTIYTVFIALGTVAFTNAAHAQGMAVNNSGSSANTSAMLDVSSTTKGVLVPRMIATQRTSISSPAEGLLVYQTDAPTGFYFYTAGSWQQLGAPANTTAQGNTFNGASQLVQLDATAKLPAVDGSQLTHLPSSGGVGSTGIVVVTMALSGHTAYTIPSSSIGGNVILDFQNNTDGTAVMTADLTLPTPVAGAKIIVSYTRFNSSINNWYMNAKTPSGNFYPSIGSVSPVSAGTYAACVNIVSSFVSDGTNWYETPTE